MAHDANAPVLLERHEGIATIRFNRPERMNVLDVASADCFRDAVAEATSASDVRVVVVTGAGDAFLAGGDLAAMRDAGSQAVDVVDAIIRPAHEAMEMLISASQPTVASVHGAVAGAGVSVALATDLAIAADNTRFNLAYVNIGAVPDCSGSWTLPRVVGLRRAMEIALLSDTINAEEAARLGLVNRVVPVAEQTAETERLAQRLAAGPPVAQAQIKRLLRGSLQRSAPEQMRAEEEAFRTCAATRDFRQGVAAFLDRKRPSFHGT